MGKTSTEVKQRWIDKSYRKYQVYFRFDDDDEIIQFIEANKERYGTTSIFRDALEMYMKSGVLDD